MKQPWLAGTFLFATVLLLGAPASADMCWGGGNRPNNIYDAGANDVALGPSGKDTRNVGFGLLAAASVGTAWLSFRRRDR
jgi:hypothetical protein